MGKGMRGLGVTERRGVRRRTDRLRSGHTRALCPDAATWTERPLSWVTLGEAQGVAAHCAVDGAYTTHPKG